ncbi:MAG: LLM class F420-dependent oxidoreductase [Pseudomonadales bacterium]
MNISVVTPLWQDQPASDNIDIALNAQRHGFADLWIGEMATFDAFSFATAVGRSEGEMALNIGPLAVDVRTAMTMAMGVASVAELTGRTVRLAIGSSSKVVVEEWHGRPRLRTAKHLEEAAGILRALLSGEKVKFRGELATCNGYHLRTSTPGAHITVAAFGALAVKAAAQQADRMLLNMVTTDSAARLKQQLEDAAKEAGRETPKLAAWLACAIDPTPEAIGQMLRSKVGYLSAPGYSDMFVEAGFGELVSFAKTRPHPKEVLAAMPAEMAAAVGMVGNIDTLRRRVSEYQAAGIDEICIVPATAGDPSAERTLSAVKALWS